MEKQIKRKSNVRRNRTFRFSEYELEINVDYQLQRKRNMEYIIEDTKTESGTRQVPMTDEVYECFKRIIANRKKPKVEPMIDGKIVFLCKFGRVERKRPQGGGEKTTMLIGYRLKDTITDFLGYGAECGK